MRISDWSSDVCSSDLVPPRSLVLGAPARVVRELSDEDIAGKTWGTRQYHKLAQRSMQTMRAVAPLARPEPNRPRLASAELEPSGAHRASASSESSLPACRPFLWGLGPLRVSTGTLP